MIANEIVKSMKKGELITTPNDNRAYFKKKLGVYEIQKLMKKFGIATGSATGYAADILEGKIFTAEEIGRMSSDEFQANEKAINNQLETIGVPREYQAQEAVQNGSMIWVDEYFRADGTKVKGYYRARPSEG